MPREVITPETCLSCGLCCTAPFGQLAFADVTNEDMKRLGRKFVRLHVAQFTTFDKLAAALDGKQIPDGAIKTTHHRLNKSLMYTACSQLKGKLLEKTECAIYEKRPQVCKTAVVPGDRACRRIRTSYKKELKDIRSKERQDDVSTRTR